MAELRGTIFLLIPPNKSPFIKQPLGSTCICPPTARRHDTAWSKKWKQSHHSVLSGLSLPNLAQWVTCLTSNHEDPRCACVGVHGCTHMCTVYSILLGSPRGLRQMVQKRTNSSKNIFNKSWVWKIPERKKRTLWYPDASGQVIKLAMVCGLIIAIWSSNS